MLSYRNELKAAQINIIHIVRMVTLCNKKKHSYKLAYRIKITNGIYLNNLRSLWILMISDLSKN